MQTRETTPPKPAQDSSTITLKKAILKNETEASKLASLKIF